MTKNERCCKQQRSFFVCQPEELVETYGKQGSYGNKQGDVGV